MHSHPWTLAKTTWLFALLAACSSPRSSAPADGGTNTTPDGAQQPADAGLVADAGLRSDASTSRWARRRLGFDESGDLRNAGGALYMTSSSVQPSGWVAEVGADGVVGPRLGGALSGSYVQAIARPDPATLLAVGSDGQFRGQLHRLVGSTWTTTNLVFEDGQPVPSAIRLYAPTASEVFVVAVNQGATVPLRYAGAPVPSAAAAPSVAVPGGAINTGVLFGFAPDDVWVVGGVGTPSQHWTGAAWEPVSGLPATACKVGTTFGTRRALCVGNSMGDAVAFDGMAWSRLVVPASAASLSPIAIASRGDDVVVLAGRSGFRYPALYAFDGTAWSEVSFDDDPSLQGRSIGVFPDGRLALTASTRSRDGVSVGDVFLLTEQR